MRSVAVNLAGVAEAPAMGSTPYRIDADGHPYVPVGDGGIVLGVALAWGFVNHLGLNILVLLLARAAPDARAAVLGVNSAVTYAAALAGVAVAGPAYARFGFGALGAGAAGVVALAAYAARRIGRE